MRIRKATRADIPSIERVMRASVAGLGSPFYDAQQIASAVEQITIPDAQLIDDNTFFVVEDDEGIVACGGWSKRKKLYTGSAEQAQLEGLLDPAKDAARIRAMFVDPSYARRGLGRLILEASEDDARRAGFHDFELMATLPGVPLYLACGYEEIEKTTIDLADGMRIGGVRMRRVK
ncbi:MAG TPA: GNAT family N-acetyltransferase [Thermoanaerobaculia bacterium]|nr:GNAT family N-acetyltransferase [Thermoanaerobaculia bacterium]